MHPPNKFVTLQKMSLAHSTNTDNYHSEEEEIQINVGVDHDGNPTNDKIDNSTT